MLKYSISIHTLQTHLQWEISCLLYSESDRKFSLCCHVILHSVKYCHDLVVV
jgi:hypothetical protein